MLYMVGKIFMWEVSFHIVYIVNELVHENMKKVENVFSHRVQKKISIFFKQGWTSVKQHCAIIHTYIYQVETFIFTLLVRIWDY